MKRNRDASVKAIKTLQKREILEKRDRANLEKEKEDEAAYGPPTFEGKTEYLYYVGVEDCVKMEQQWKEGFQMIKTTLVMKPRKARKKSVKRLK